MKLRNKVIVPVLTGTIIFSGYGILKYKMIEDENVQLKNELEKNKNNNSNNKVSYITTVDEIKEINSNNIDLVLYESDYTNYETVLDDTTLFGINANIKTKFKYDVVINLSKAKVDKNGNKIIVKINESDIRIHEIEIGKIDISYDLNIFTRFRGEKITEIETDILMNTYSNIDRLVNKDYILNKELYKLRLIEKLEKLYPFDVDVIFI